VLLLDEPENGLDSRTRNRLMEILIQLTIPFVLISHELDFLTATTHVVFTMENGRIILDKELHIHEHVHAHPLGARPHEH
jgi:cobalt/nickel transport system ATP-binding protein